jgi:hypothetical protein
MAMPNPCRRCRGAGNETHNPAELTRRFSRVDPQDDQDFSCQRCMGSGVEPSEERLADLYSIATEWQQQEAA